MHTLNQKSYIGYTSKSLSERLHKHITNALSGIDSHFYRSIRKYGSNSIKSKILGEYNSQTDAVEAEKEYILFYDTINSGMNCTPGGTGGDTFTYNVNKDRIRKRYSYRSSGQRNGNYSGLTDDDIIECAIKYFKNNGKLILRQWFTYCKTIGYPQKYTKFRFDGNSCEGFISRLKSELTTRNIYWNDNSFKYIRKEDKTLLKKLSDCVRGKIHYNDGNKNYFIFSTDNRIKKLNLQKGMLKNVKNTKNR